MSSEEIKNSEILLIYEAKLCNPNGDPDDENRPRIDPRTRTNLVSDVRLKRFFRNYIVERYGEDYIWVTKVGGKSVDATKRFNDFKDLADIKNKCIDVRLFGATIPLKGQSEGKGEAHSIIGPVQFTWGYSLHPVELVDSVSITSVFKGRSEEDRGETEYGTIGKDWRLYYSLIAFYGVISSTRGKYTGLSSDDIKLFDNVLWDSIIIDSTTRSKIGHRPHLYLRIEHDNTFDGDLRRLINVSYKEPIRSLEDFEIKLDRLKELLQSNNYYLRCSEEFSKYLNPNRQNLPHTNLDLEKIIKRNIST